MYKPTKTSYVTFHYEPIAPVVHHGYITGKNLIFNALKMAYYFYIVAYNT